MELEIGALSSIPRTERKRERERVSSGQVVHGCLVTIWLPGGLGVSLEPGLWVSWVSHGVLSFAGRPSVLLTSFPRPAPFRFPSGQVTFSPLSAFCLQIGMSVPTPRSMTARLPPAASTSRAPTPASVTQPGTPVPPGQAGPVRVCVPCPVLGWARSEGDFSTGTAL